MKQIIMLLLFLLTPLTVKAQVIIQIQEGSGQKFPIAVPQFLTESGSHNSLSRKMTDLLKKDLQIAGYFNVLDEDRFLEDDKDAYKIDFSKWVAIEAHGLVKGIIDTTSGGRIIVEFRLYDTQTQKLLVGKQYTVKKDQYVQAIHRFMDEIMLALTGKRGPFSSLVAAACGKNGARQIRYFSIDGAIYGGLPKIKTNNISPNWSPNGNTIVFTSFTHYFPEIFSMSVGGGGLKQLTNNKSTNITPAFSPDGSKIAYASSVSGDTELYLMTPSGRTMSRLTNVLNIDVSPAWSPDGSRIVFASERAGNLHLFAGGLGGGASRLTYTGYQNDQPDWSPDGSKIVFTARDRGAFDIFVINADGSFIQRLTRDEGNNESPTWSPDSRYISFESRRSGASGIYVMMKDGDNQTLIPNTGGCINPDWGPWTK